MAWTARGPVEAGLRGTLGHGPVSPPPPKPPLPNISQKSFWKIINRVTNKCRTPKIPPLLVNNLFILNCRYFNDLFSQQCKLVIDNSVLPTHTFLTDNRINYGTIENNEIISIIRKTNINKDTDPRGFSGQMLLLCDESVILPLQIIFTNILSTFGNWLMWLQFFKREINN